MITSLRLYRLALLTLMIGRVLTLVVKCHKVSAIAHHSLFAARLS